MDRNGWRAVPALLAILGAGWSIDGTEAARAQDFHGSPEDGLPALPAASAVRQPDWGSQDASILALNAWDFEKIVESQTWSFTTGLFRFRTSAVANPVYAGFHLPAGALVTGMALEACDTSPTDAAVLVFWTCDAGIGGACNGSILSTGDAEDGGCGIFTLPMTRTIDNANKVYYLGAGTGTQNSTTSFRGVRLYYKLQVSPAPATATFTDVPTNHPFFQYVEALRASGITAGCGTATLLSEQPRDPRADGGLLHQGAGHALAQLGLVTSTAGTPRVAGR